MSRKIEAVIQDLTAARAEPEVIAAARESLERNFPEKVYTHAVWFLGSATMVLVIGAVASLLLEKTPSEAMWTAVGAGLGALAGVFTAKSGT